MGENGEKMRKEKNACDMNLGAGETIAEDEANQIEGGGWKVIRMGESICHICAK